MALLINGVRCVTRKGQNVLRAICETRGRGPSVVSCKTSQTWLASLSPIAGCQGIHTSTTCLAKIPAVPELKEPKTWPQYNNIVYPPRKVGEAIRPAEITHLRANIKYSGKKLWYIGLMIRGMSVEEAIKQLSFYKRKGAQIVAEILEEAQEMAVKEHNVEFKSNLWVADAYHKKAMKVFGVRKGGRGRMTKIRFRYSHFFVRLREGPPPKHYYKPEPTGHEKLNNYLQKLRDRRIWSEL